MYYLIFMTSPTIQINSNLSNHLFHIFKLIIDIVTYIYVQLIENINTQKIEFICIIGQILTSIVCIDVSFEIHDISIQYKVIDIFISYFQIDYSYNNMHIYEIN